MFPRAGDSSRDKGSVEGGHDAEAGGERGSSPMSMLGGLAQRVGAPALRRRVSQRREGGDGSSEHDEVGIHPAFDPDGDGAGSAFVMGKVAKGVVKGAKGTVETLGAGAGLALRYANGTSSERAAIEADFERQLAFYRTLYQQGETVLQSATTPIVAALVASAVAKMPAEQRTRLLGMAADAGAPGIATLAGNALGEKLTKGLAKKVGEQILRALSAAAFKLFGTRAAAFTLPGIGPVLSGLLQAGELEAAMAAAGRLRANPHLPGLYDELYAMRLELGWIYVEDFVETFEAQALQDLLELAGSTKAAVQSAGDKAGYGPLLLKLKKWIPGFEMKELKTGSGRTEIKYTALYGALRGELHVEPDAGGAEHAPTEKRYRGGGTFDLVHARLGERKGIGFTYDSDGLRCDRIVLTPPLLPAGSELAIGFGNAPTASLDLAIPGFERKQRIEGTFKEDGTLRLEARGIDVGLRSALLEGLTLDVEYDEGTGLTLGGDATLVLSPTLHARTRFRLAPTGQLEFTGDVTARQREPHAAKPAHKAEWPESKLTFPLFSLALVGSVNGELGVKASYETQFQTPTLEPTRVQLRGTLDDLKNGRLPDAEIQARVAGGVKTSAQLTLSAKLYATLFWLAKLGIEGTATGKLEGEARLDNTMTLRKQGDDYSGALELGALAARADAKLGIDLGFFASVLDKRLWSHKFLGVEWPLASLELKTKPAATIDVAMKKGFEPTANLATLPSSESIRASAHASLPLLVQDKERTAVDRADGPVKNELGRLSPTEQARYNAEKKRMVAEEEARIRRRLPVQNALEREGVPAPSLGELEKLGLLDVGDVESQRSPEAVEAASHGLFDAARAEDARNLKAGASRKLTERLAGPTLALAARGNPALRRAILDLMQALGWDAERKRQFTKDSDPGATPPTGPSSAPTGVETAPRTVEHATPTATPSGAPVRTPPGPGEFEIEIKLSLTGSTVHVNVSATDTVEQLRVKGGPEIADLRLFAAGKQMEDERTLADYNVKPGGRLLGMIRFVR